MTGPAATRDAAPDPLPAVAFTHAELWRVALPLVAPFATAHGTEHVRELLLVHLLGPDGEGWGECAALSTPGYTAEYADGAQDVLVRFLLPRLGAGPVHPVDVAGRLAGVHGHPMAKAAVEMAVLDASLRRADRSLAAHLGAVADHVPAGVAIGFRPSVEALLEEVGARVAEGYQRVKLKIEPGRDVELVDAVRRRFGDELPLQVDANGSYTPAEADRLAALDAYGLVLVEQPLAEDDLLGHARLAARLATPICLDESITSLPTAELALEIGACSVVCLKPARVGGLLEAVRIHDLCHARGTPVWCGGMLSSGLARAADVALAALPGCTLPGDVSASDRYFHRDLTEPFALEGGRLGVPPGPGLGVAPLPEVLAELGSVRAVVALGDGTAPATGS